MRLRWTTEAAEDLESIYEFLLVEHPEFAQSTVRKIISEIEVLKKFPLIGRQLPRPNTRALIMSRIPYVCLYRPSEEFILLLSIFHTARDRSVDLQ